MNIDKSILQDFTDILQIHKERATDYNISAYSCEHMQLKLMLCRELDNARDSSHSILRLLHERFKGAEEPKTLGQLYTLWSDLKPSFSNSEIKNQLRSYEKADSLTLQCYEHMLARPALDNVSKTLLEFQYQNHRAIYESIKVFLPFESVTLHRNHHT